MKHILTCISLLLTAAMLLALCACGTASPAAEEDNTIEETTEAAVVTTESEEAVNNPASAEEDASAEMAETEEEPAETEEPLSETTLAEMELFDAIDYSNGNIMTEAEFYRILEAALALHGLELTPYSGGNGYFYFNYSNLEGVRLLTASRTADELAADQEAAWADYDDQVAEYAAEKAALSEGESVTDAEETSDADASEEISDDASGEASGETAETAGEFDPTKDVENSQDYVISFVLSAGTGSDDQQVMFLVSAIVWCIMDPHFDNTDDAFAYLWRALYTTYGNSEGLSASTIDGIDSGMPFTIPGNAAEAWLSTDDSGNYILAITNYAVYDEIIDINSTGDGLPTSILTGTTTTVG